MRTALVFLHASPGVVGLLVGMLTLRPPRPGDGRRRWRLIYAVCIAVLATGLVALLAYDWGALDTTARAAFAGLACLAVVMGYRLRLARLEARRRRDGWQERYVTHVYFTYVSLWVGFLIIPALNLPLPQVGVPLTVVAVLLIGNRLIGQYKQRLQPADP
jgi:hypothetical protein